MESTGTFSNRKIKLDFPKKNKEKNCKQGVQMLPCLFKNIACMNLCFLNYLLNTVASIKYLLSSSSWLIWQAFSKEV